jgi:hypothetical protein
VLYRGSQSNRDREQRSRVAEAVEKGEERGEGRSRHWFELGCDERAVGKVGVENRLFDQKMYDLEEVEAGV